MFIFLGAAGFLALHRRSLTGENTEFITGWKASVMAGRWSGNKPVSVQLRGGGRERGGVPTRGASERRASAREGFQSAGLSDLDAV